MQKLFINNRYGLRMAVVVERPWFARGTAIVMHGLASTKEQAHVSACANVFDAQRYITVRFDVTNSLGESSGDIKKATVTSYFEDLEDVVSWVRMQPWFRYPLILAGHSLGGMCTTLYAERNPHLVSALVPMSPAVSGSLLLDAVEKRYPEEVRIWRETGKVVFGKTVPEYVRRVLPDDISNFMSYDLLPKASELAMPSLFVVGGDDWLTPPASTQKLYEVVPPGKKELHVIPGAPHSFKEKDHIDKMVNIMVKWIQTIR